MTTTSSQGTHLQCVSILAGFYVIDNGLSMGTHRFDSVENFMADAGEGAGFRVWKAV